MRLETQEHSGLSPACYAWLRDFMKPLKERLEFERAGDATQTEVDELRRENQRLRQLVGSSGTASRNNCGIESVGLPTAYALQKQE